MRTLLIGKRKQKGITQKDLSEILGKPQSYVSKYEIGERNIDIIEFIRISNALNAPPEELLKEFLTRYNEVKNR